MNRGYIAGCCLIVAAAVAGYWIFAEKLPAHRPPPPTLVPPPDAGSDPSNDKPMIYGSHTTADIIDLARVYDPTGEELELSNLLYGQPVAELIPAPREAEPEIAPIPREAERELLHAPKPVNDWPEAAEEASSPPLPSPVLHQPFTWMIACCLADWLNRSLPLKGSTFPSSDPAR